MKGQTAFSHSEFRVVAQNPYSKLPNADWGSGLVVANGFVVALFALWVQFHWGGPDLAAAISDSTSILLGLSLVVLARRASTTAGLPGFIRLGWQLFALACLGDWLGNCLWGYSEVFLGQTPISSLADVGHLIFIPLALAAVLSFVGPMESRTERGRVWVYAATVSIGIGAAAWYLLIYPIYASGQDGLLALLIAEAYPVGGILLLFGVSALMCRRRLTSFRQPFAWLGAGLTLHLVADASFAYLKLRGAYESGGITDLFYNLAYFLMMLGAHLQRRAPHPDAESIAPSAEGLGTGVIPLAAALIAYGLLFAAPRDLWQSPLGGIVIAVTLLAALAVTKQRLWARAYAQLHREQALLASQTRLAAVFAHAPIGMALLGPDQRLAAVNPALASFLGLQPQRLVGEPLTRFAHAEDVASLSRAFASPASSERLKARFVRPADRRIIVCDARAVSLPTQDGEAPLPLLMLEDITALDAAQEALEQSHHQLEAEVAAQTDEVRASEERLRLIFDSCPDGLIMFDPDGRIIFANPAAETMLCWPEGDLLGLRLLDVLEDTHPDAPAHDGEASDLKEHLRTADADRVEGRCFGRRDGAPFAVSYSVRAICRDGVQLGAVLAFSDATLRREAELATERARAEAERLAQVKGDFLANMSHEIRTPLNGILGRAQIGLRKSGDHPALQRDFAGIMASGWLLLALVNDILDFSKIEAGKLAIESIPFDTVHILDQVVESFDDQAKEKGLDLYRILGCDFPPHCQGDPVRLTQILFNLVGNAVKFTPNGRVTLEGTREGDTLVFRVSDTGIGIDADQIERLFAPFEQADSGTTRRFGGTGLGLAITRRLVELMDGEIRVQSALGRGTLFEVRLPYRAAEGDIVPDLPGLPANAGPRLAEVRLLVAEDNEVNQLIIEDMLSTEGARTTLVGNGRAAVDAVKATPLAWDAVLMDVQMPEMDGLEATRLIKRLAPALPVIGQTAQTLGEDRARCLAAGMVDQIAKPLLREELINAVLRQCKPSAGLIPLDAAPSCRADDPPPKVETVDWNGLAARHHRRPAFLERLALLTIEKHRETPDALRCWAAAGNLAAIGRQAHSLKGVAGNLIARDAEELALRTQLAAESGDPATPQLALALAVAMESVIQACADRFGKGSPNVRTSIEMSGDAAASLP